MELLPVEYRVGDKSYTGFLADGSGGAAAPGVLVAHEGGGLGAHARDKAARLAGLGYVAFALDLFGDPGLTLEQKMALVRALRADVAELRARMRVPFEWLAERCDASRMAAIGFCFGGAAAIELARTGADLKAVVGFHAGLATASAEDNKAIRGKLLLCLGADDPIVTAGQREAFAAEMSEAGVDWQIHLYGGVGHSFTNPEIDSWNFAGFRYDAAADERSWAAMRALFEEVL